MEMDRQPYLDMPLIVSGYFVCRKTPFTVAFFEEWLALAEDMRLLTDAPNSCGLPNYPQIRRPPPRPKHSPALCPQAPEPAPTPHLHNGKRGSIARSAAD